MHPSADNYGITKRLAVLQARHYARQYGVRTSSVVLANTYGPRDHFGPTRSHVLAALLQRVRQARDTAAPEVVVWGRGIAERDLLYVDDAIQGTLLVVEHCPDVGLMNIATGRGVSVREIAETVVQAVGYRGRVTFDASRPEGPLRKIFAVDRLRQTLGWSPPTQLAEGVRRTLAWLERGQNQEVAA
jgi:GDP-L-fucose synthase